MEKKVALVFPIYNKLDYTKKGLAYIYNCFDAKGTDIIPVDIVITDDGSSDGSYEWINANYPNIFLVKGNGNLWWSGGINKAIEFTLKNLKHEYVLLWNNDIRPDKAYFSNLFDLLKNNNPDTILCSKIYIENQNEIVLSMGGIFNPVTGDYKLNGYGQKDNSSLNEPVVVDWFGGMGTSIHRTAFKVVGFFDEKKFPQYHGDSDFALRARKAGFRILACPQLKIWNDRTNTGYSNDASFTIFMKSLFSMKSNFNILKDIQFYHRHATHSFAYRYLLGKYFRHIGGYIKWKFLSVFGKRRSTVFGIK
jgi:GT2 family glycosyltransferase